MDGARRVGRREFIKLGSGALALGVAGSAIPAHLFAKTPEALCESLGDAPDGEALRAIAKRALDAATAAGAQYADVRVNFMRVMSLGADFGNLGARVWLDRTLGVRAVVNGAWGFAGGYDLACAPVASLAQLAVSRAKAATRAGKVRSFEFAPAPVVQGHWETPIVTDPFTVPVSEQVAACLEARREVDKIKGVRAKSGGVGWYKSERIFASTEGSLVTQRTYHAGVGAFAETTPAYDQTVRISVGSDSVRGGYGYEALALSNLKSTWPAAAEEAVRRATSPFKSVDVGRYDLVMSSEAMAYLMARTIGQALELDRVRGDKANSAGTSFAAPPLEILGRYQLGSPLLTLTADRSRPHAGGTVGWDEEGVKPEEFTLIKDGIVMDYLTTRRTAPTLAPWYSSQNRLLRSHGCAGGSGDHAPFLRLTNLTLQPGKEEIGAEELIKGVKRGFYVEDVWGLVDQQCLNGQFGVQRGHEIRNGKRGALVKDMAVQCSTPQLWKSLQALGGPGSVKLEPFRVGSSVIDHLQEVGVQSVPGYFKGVNVVNTGKLA